MTSTNINKYKTRIATTSSTSLQFQYNCFFCVNITNMKAPYFLAFLAAAVSAQNAGIGFPTKDQEITAGENLVVQIQRPVSSDHHTHSVAEANCRIRTP